MTGEKVRNHIAGIPFEGRLSFMEPMSRHTSLRIGGPADIFAVPGNAAALVCLHDYLLRNGTAFFPLGAGTNILVRDGGIEGAVICFSAFRTIETVAEDGDFAYLSAGAGAYLQGIVAIAKERGYSGIEGLAGIPGTIGGAICGNAGSFGYEMQDVLVSIDVMASQGGIRKVRPEDISFGYRTSDILPTDLLLGATIKLRKEKKEEVAARIEHFMNMKRESQPVRELSAGCVFKNPGGQSAGKLIDEAGCKGMRVGDVVVSAVHANFFINTGKACAADFIRLMQEVSARVGSRFGIDLEPEIRIVGRAYADR